MDEAILDIIDGDGKVISSAKRSEVYQEKLRHRIVHVLIHDGKGRLACQVRSEKMSFCPGCYSTSVGGHVESGESPEKAAKREMEEELGVIGELSLIFSDWYKGHGLTKLLSVFQGKIKTPFKLNPEEVERIEYLTYDELRKLPDDIIHPELKFILQKYEKGKVV